jgi:hypothetical protein
MQQVSNCNISESLHSIQQFFEINFIPITAKAHKKWDNQITILKSLLHFVKKIFETGILVPIYLFCIGTTDYVHPIDADIKDI